VTGLIKQGVQNLKGPRLQPYSYTVLALLTGIQAHFKRAEFDRGPSSDHGTTVYRNFGVGLTFVHARQGVLPFKTNAEHICSGIFCELLKTSSTDLVFQDLSA
jgi:hypothetical protein